MNLHQTSLKLGREFRKVKTVKNALCSKPGERGYSFLEMKHCRRKGQKYGLAAEITGRNVTNPKYALISSLGKDVGFGDNFFYDAYRMSRSVVSFG
jgi:hypothetical protein